MTTLGALLGLVAGKLPYGYKGAATGGSTTTLVDSNMPAFGDDYWNGGLLAILSGTLADTTITVTDYTSATRTIVFTTQTAALASGVNYIVLTSQYTKPELVNAVNQALKHVGAYTQANSTLTTVPGQAQYTLPAGVRNVKRVQIAQNLTDPRDFEFDFTWAEVGSALEFSKAPDMPGRVIRIWYDMPHAAVINDTDNIADVIDDNRLSWTAIYYATMYLAGKQAVADDQLIDLMRVSQVQMDKLAAEHPVNTMSKTPRYAKW